MAQTDELKTDAQNFVRQTMTRISGQQPSAKAVKQAANCIVRALRPIVTSSQLRKSRTSGTVCPRGSQGNGLCPCLSASFRALDAGPLARVTAQARPARAPQPTKRDRRRLSAIAGISAGNG